jgi:8-oxo-dGTP pyrophosphatase MutT (NUDIX family)
MSARPRVTVAALAEELGCFLVVEEEHFGTLVYNQPAGHLEAGESLVDAVCRETLEETGWRFAPTYLVGVYRWHRPEDGVTFVRFCFAGTCTDYDPARPLDAGIRRALWLPRADLVAPTARLRSPMVLRCIDDYLAGQHFPLDMLVDLA